MASANRGTLDARPQRGALHSAFRHLLMLNHAGKGMTGGRGLGGSEIPGWLGWETWTWRQPAVWHSGYLRNVRWGECF
jgi:hypothetical protein